LRNKDFCGHLNYVSQDNCQYDGGDNNEPMQTGEWNTSGIDIIGDIASIPEADGSFDVIMCTEVFEYLPYPIPAIKEFQRLLKKDGMLIITAPFCSLTYFAPYHFSTSFNCHFYEHHLNHSSLNWLKRRLMETISNILLRKFGDLTILQKLI
jgi:ubiquinone/menaquinone biosynthesis C-methylase UbiE